MIALDKRGAISYYKSMKDTQKCNECGGRGEQKVFCSFNIAPGPVFTQERTWYAINDAGQRAAFMMSVRADKDKALEYAQRKAENIVACGASRVIVDVEAGEESTRMV